MSRRYIELYSANRNRNQYPLPSSFEVPFAPTRQLSSSLQSFDALCTGPIYYKWCGGTQTGATCNFKWPSSSPPLTDDVKSDSNSTSSLIYLSTVSTDLSPIFNYYVGYKLKDITSGVERTIISYDPSTSKFVLEQPFPSFTAGNTINIVDPSTSSKIHIPIKDINNNNIRSWSNSYDGCYIMDETSSLANNNIIYSMITSYDYTTQMATLDRELTGWATTNTFTIRKTIPQEIYSLTSNPVNNVGTFVYYNGIIYISSMLPSYSNAINVPGMIVTLPAGFGNREYNYYAGKYIYNTSNSANPSLNGGGIYGLYFIKSSYYNSSTNLIELLVDHSIIPQLNINCNSSSSSPYTKSPSENFIKENDVINIVNYIKDNYSPLNYNGSIVSQSEAVCYEVSLITLTLPNISLRSGARAAFYPFFYVEFSNSTSPSGASNAIIYSNSPSSNKALFIVPVTDTQQPLNSSFVKLASNMSQTVKFKPNDSLRFSVYLPDGRPFETVEQDYLSPYPPNGIVQINAVFGIRRI
jgi:hypothetical protein